MPPAQANHGHVSDLQPAHEHGCGRVSKPLISRVDGSPELPHSGFHFWCASLLFCRCVEAYFLGARASCGCSRGDTHTGGRPSAASWRCLPSVKSQLTKSRVRLASFSSAPRLRRGYRGCLGPQSVRQVRDQCAKPLIPQSTIDQRNQTLRSVMEPESSIRRRIRQ